MRESLDRLILQALTLQPNHGHGISQRLERLTRGGFEVNQGTLYPVLGIFEGFDYPQAQVQLRRGDRLVLFTDGVTELWNREGEEFGEERLLTLVRRHRMRPAADLRDLIVDTAADFSRGDFHDDLTLVVVAVG